MHRPENLWMFTLWALYLVFNISLQADLITSSHRLYPNAMAMHFDVITQTTFRSGLGLMWQHSFSRVYDHVSWATVKDCLLN